MTELNEQNEQNLESSEPVLESQETIQETPQDNSDGGDISQPVTSLDQAKEVLKAQKTSSSESTKSKTQSQQELNYRKQYEEIQKVVGKQSGELGELRKFFKENQPVIDAYKKALSAQQDAELANQYQQNPMEVMRELARREAMQSVAPYQEQIVAAQASNINSSIKEALGSDYDSHAPVMADILDEFQEMDAAKGSNYAQELANNPRVLVQLAAGRVAMNNKAQSTQQNNESQQRKAQNLKVANGVAKTNSNTASAPESYADMSLEQMTLAMKKQGILK